MMSNRNKPVWWLAPIAAVVGLSIALSSKKASASSRKGSNVSDPEYAPAVWSPIIASLIGVDPKYARCKFGAAMAWGGEESGFNACAIGEPGEVAEDGSNQEPREIGLGQLYNPDDFRKLGINPSKLRAYCDPGTQHRNRKLTADEMIEQVKYTILEPMLWGLQFADNAVTAYGLQAWPEADFWKLVKVKHAYHLIVDQGMPAVLKKLGRSPANWLEFRQELGMDDPAVRAKAAMVRRKLATFTPHERMVWGWMRALDNCEAIGNAVAGTGTV